MAFKGWFDGELRPDAWFDAEVQPAGWFDTEIIDTPPGVGTVAAVCIGADGALTYRPAATETDRKLYLNTGQLFARLSAVGGDKVVSLSAGAAIAT